MFPNTSRSFRWRTYLFIFFTFAQFSSNKNHFFIFIINPPEKAKHAVEFFSYLYWPFEESLTRKRKDNRVSTEWIWNKCHEVLNDVWHLWGWPSEWTSEWWHMKKLKRIADFLMNNVKNICKQKIFLIRKFSIKFFKQLKSNVLFEHN